MIIDANALALDMNLRLSAARKSMNFTPALGVVSVPGGVFGTSDLSRIAERAKDLDILIKETKIEDSTVIALAKAIKDFVDDAEIDGIIVLMPNIEGVDRDEIMRLIPLDKDVSVSSPEARALFAQENLPILPPMIGAVQHVFERQGISVSGREALVVGHGPFVGAPVAQFLRHCGARVTVVDRPVKDLTEFTDGMELIVMAEGASGKLKTEQVMDRAIIINASNSEELIDSDAVEKSAIFVTMQNGFDEMRVSSLLKNILILARRRTS